MNKQEIEKLKKKFPEGAYSEGVEIPPPDSIAPWMKGIQESDFEDDAVPEELDDVDEEKDDQK
jgi:hypothetical protein